MTKKKGKSGKNGNQKPTGARSPRDTAYAHLFPTETVECVPDVPFGKHILDGRYNIIRVSASTKVAM